MEPATSTVVATAVTNTTANSALTWERTPWATPLARARLVALLQEAGVVLALTLLCALFFWRFLTTDTLDRVMIPQGDFGYQFYSTRVFVFRELRAGRLPLWMPSIYSGYPIQADPQSAIFYPPALLLSLAAALAGLKAFPFRLLEMEVIGHVLLASVFTYAFLRVQLRRRWSALLGGVVFAYGGYLTGYPLQQMAILEAAIWLPLGLLGIWLRYRGGRPHALWLTALALGMSLLAGHPQTSLLVAYGLLAYQLYQLWRARVPWYQGLKEAALPPLVAAALSAVQLLPSVQYTLLSTRADLSVAEAGTGFPVQDIVQFLVTGLVSHWHPLYIGIWPLLLAFIAASALFRRGAIARRADIVFWCGWSVVTLLLSFGQHLFGFELAYLLLPGYSLFRGQERLAFLVSLGLGILAAYGADLLWSQWPRAERPQLVGLARFLRGALWLTLLALLITVFVHRYGLDPSDSGQLPNHIALLALMLGGSIVLLYGRIYAARQRTAWNVVAVAWVLLNLFSANRGLNEAPLQTVYPQTPAIKLLTADRDEFRLQEDYRLPPQAASVYGLQEVRGIAPIRPAHYDRFLNRAPEALRWKLLNVKYVVTWRGSLTTQEGVQVPAVKLYQEGKDKEILYVYRLQEPGPRAWVVHDLYIARNDQELYAYLGNANLNPYRIAVLREAISLSPGGAGGREEVRWIEHLPTRLRLEAQLASEGLLVLSEVTYPGWRAYVNGRLAPIREAYGVLRAVVLPAGESRVEFLYQPLPFYLGALLSLCAWLILGGVVAVCWYRRRLSVAAQVAASPTGPRAEGG